MFLMALVEEDLSYHRSSFMVSISTNTSSFCDSLHKLPRYSLRTVAFRFSPATIPASMSTHIIRLRFPTHGASTKSSDYE
jgi:hypothetical protein